VLPDLKQLTYVGLGSNEIKPMGVFYLTAAIYELQYLEGLDLSGKEGVGILAESLVTLKSCSLGQSAALRLLLSQHQRLKSLDVRFNVSATAFHPGTLLHCNTALSSLQMTGFQLCPYSLWLCIWLWPVFQPWRNWAWDMLPTLKKPPPT